MVGRHPDRLQEWTCLDHVKLLEPIHLRTRDECSSCHWHWIYLLPSGPGVHIPLFLYYIHMDDSLAYFSRVRLLESKDDNALFDIVCRGGVITDVVPFVPENKRNGYETFTDAREALLIPS
jgi:hypothetical protein